MVKHFKAVLVKNYTTMAYLMDDLWIVGLTLSTPWEISGYDPIKNIMLHKPKPENDREKKKVLQESY